MNFGLMPAILSMFGSDQTDIFVAGIRTVVSNDIVGFGSNINRSPSFLSHIRRSFDLTSYIEQQTNFTMER